MVYLIFVPGFCYKILIRLSIVFFLLVASAASTTAVKKQDGKIAELLKEFSTRLECSGVFARLVAVVTTKFAESKKKEGALDSLIHEYLGADNAQFTAAMEAVKSQLPRGIIDDIDDDSVQTCFPLRNNVGKFFSIRQADARLIAAAIRNLALSLSTKSSSKRKTKQTPDSVAVLDIVVEVSEQILNLLTEDQLQIAFTMNQLAVVNERFEKGVCTGSGPKAVGEWFLRDVPTMDIQFQNDYLPAVYRLLRRFVVCGFGRDEEIKLLQLRQEGLPEKITAIKERPEATTTVSSDPADGVMPPASPVEPRTETEVSNRAPIPIDTSVHKKEENEYGLSHQTFITSSIAHENKLFFDNLHAAAQQLTLLGIKAVGLATQIQAIRGDLMMLELIDQHIETLNEDHTRYSGLLIQAHTELKIVTGSQVEETGN